MALVSEMMIAKIAQPGFSGWSRIIMFKENAGTVTAIAIDDNGDLKEVPITDINVKN
jgi:hypothetical protein